MSAKARTFLVPYPHPERALGDVWGEGPYYSIRIGSRRNPNGADGGADTGAYYHSLEMLANLHKEIGALLAKKAHAPTQQ